MSGERLEGERVPRVEDRRFLRGEGRYIADIPSPDALHIVFVRSAFGHARLLGVDVSAARALPGVVAVYTGEDLVGHVRPIRTALELPTYRASGQPALATGKVRFAGEPVAAVIATDPYVAEDAAELVLVDYDPLPVVRDAEEASAPGAPVLHEEIPDNVLFRGGFAGGDVAAALASAELVVRGRFRNARSTSAPIETRGCLAVPDAATGQVVFHTTTQIPFPLRAALALHLGMSESDLRVIVPDMGGSFGVKANLNPEDLVTIFAARRLGRPVRWIEDRREHLMASIQAREQIHEVELGLNRDGTLVGLRARIIGNAGAYSIYPWSSAIEPELAGRMLLGPYKIPAFAYRSSSVHTNKAPQGMCRGVSQTVATMVMEAILDRAARAIGRDPASLRLQNMVQPGEFPYTAASMAWYDSGSYVESLREAMRILDYDALRARQAALRAEGRHIGVGFACFVEASGPGSVYFGRLGNTAMAAYETARVTVDSSGGVTIRSGTCPHGQSHETVYSQLAADALGVAIGAVRVVFGDTDRAARGNGSWASRSAVIGSGAVRRALRAARERVTAIAAHLLGVEPDGLSFEQGRFAVSAEPERALTLAQVARVAWLSPERLPPGTPPGIETEGHFDPMRATFSNACHAAVVEVDAETGFITLQRFVVVEDCGNMLNPMVVDGQVHGGAAHGIGNGLYEALEYDENGQLQQSTFAEYMVPTSQEIPLIEVAHLVSPATLTEGGVKGMGESGAMGGPAAIRNAVCDALAPFGVEIDHVPVTPEDVFRALRSAQESK